MADDEVRGRHVVVVGGGRSGVGAAELLVARGALVTITDLKAHLADEARLRNAGITLALGGHPSGLMRTADLVVVSPGVPWQQPVLVEARQAGVPVIGEIELAWRFARGRVVAITGTKGKSTTTTLVGRMLAAAGIAVTAGGNLGTALSAQVAQSTPETVHVVEVSSFQLEGIERFRPWIAVLLNVSTDHLDRHASFEEYVNAKGRLFANQRETDWAVVNADDAAAVSLAGRTRARRRMFAMDAAIAEGIATSGSHIVERTATGEIPLIPLSAVRLIGRHLVSDVLAAAAAARLAGASPEAMTAAVAGFTRAGAHAGGGRGNRRRPVRERHEGHEHRGGPPFDRELRRRCRAHHRRPVQGRRLQGSPRARGRPCHRGCRDRGIEGAGPRGARRSRAGHRGAVDG